MEMESQLASGELKVHRVGELTPSDRDALEKRLRLR
jgi:hypothetical protein